MQPRKQRRMAPPLVRRLRKNPVLISVFTAVVTATTLSALALATTSCARKDAAAEQDQALPRQAYTEREHGGERHSGAPASLDEPSARAVSDADLGPTGTTVYSVNMNIVADDPGRTLSQVEDLLQKLGGEIAYSNSSAAHANLNGRLPIELRQRFRDAVTKMGVRVESDNMSANDVGQELRRLRRRLRSLRDAELHVATMLAGGGEAAPIEVASILRELTDRERQSVETQLDSYATQTRDAQVGVSVTQPQPQP